MKSDNNIDADFGRNPPTSCSDLSKMGHTINGIFLVNKAAENSNKVKLAALFCDFQSPLSTVSNSISIIFYYLLQITTSLSYGILIFFLSQPVYLPPPHPESTNFRFHLTNMATLIMSCMFTSEKIQRKSGPQSAMVDLTLVCHPSSL